MEIGAVFILLVLLIVLAVLGALFYGVFAWLRHLKLDPERDKLEDRRPTGPEREQRRPRHIRHGRSQRARFIGSR
jgi:hypothetical protein